MKRVFLSGKSAEREKRQIYKKFLIENFCLKKVFTFTRIVLSHSVIRVNSVFRSIQLHSTSSQLYSAPNQLLSHLKIAVFSAESAVFEAELAVLLDNILGRRVYSQNHLTLLKSPVYRCFSPVGLEGQMIFEINFSQSQNGATLALEQCLFWKSIQLVLLCKSGTFPMLNSLYSRRF